MKKRDVEYLGKLRDYYAKHRILPSYSVMAELVGMKSTSASAAMAKRLKEAGYLESGPAGRLQPGPKFFEREVADVIRAGQPEQANDNPANSFSIDEYLIDTPSRTVLLTVEGDSMIEAGLLSGDTIVVKKGAPAREGDIVVALVDNEYTVKYLAADDDGFFLRPGNAGYSDIRPDTHLEIYGLVVGCFRKF